jgi:hypothetical protein
MDFGKYQISKDRQMDGRTDMMKLTVAFHSFVNVPNKQVKAH